MKRATDEEGHGYQNQKTRLFIRGLSRELLTVRTPE